MIKAMLHQTLPRTKTAGEVTTVYHIKHGYRFNLPCFTLTSGAYTVRQKIVCENVPFGILSPYERVAGVGN